METDNEEQQTDEINRGSGRHGDAVRAGRGYGAERITA